MTKLERTAIIIAGASGDLARRKIVPALNILHKAKQLCGDCVVVGTGRTSFSEVEFRERFNVSDEFAKMLYYHTGINGIREFVKSKGNFKKTVVFLALPPSTYTDTIKVLSGENYTKDELTVIIEKPFGYDLESARKLDSELTKYLDEKQIYRIDHYLAKEAAQNILVFRFANSVFRPVWNSKYIDSIQINAYEDIGIEDRGAYFDSAGIIRDMVQNHLIQLLSLMTMEAPVSLDPEDIRTQKINIMRALKVEQVYRFQYEGYRNEKNVTPDSTTETFAELKLTIQNLRWGGMPIYIRAGKALNRKGTEIGVKFKPLPKILFNETGELEENKIIFKIQPAAGIVIDMSSKMPGSDFRITNTNMNFCYRDSFSGKIPEAYQKLLLDALRRDKTLFVSSDETELSWKLFDNFLDKGDVKTYPRGEAPKTCFGEEWIDFDKYASFCE